MSEIKKLKPGDVLEFRKKYTPEFVRQMIEQKHLKGMSVSEVLKDEKFENLEFLAEYAFLEGLGLTTHDHSYNFLKALNKLRWLVITNPGKYPIVLNNQSNLESLDIIWRNNIIGLEKCTKLKELIIWDYKEAGLGVVRLLKQLMVLEFKTASLRNLVGINEITTLGRLLLGYCRSLISIKDLNGLPRLRELAFSSCPEIQDYDLLKDLPSLESLDLTNCGKIPSIKFIRHFPKLMHFYMFGNTDVIDSDLTPAKFIKDVRYVHRRHYNIKIENKEAEELYKRNLKILRK